MVAECHRVLKTGGAYLMVTHAAPAGRLHYLWPGRVGWSRVHVYEVGQQGAMRGPYDVMADEGRGVDTLPPRLSYSHFVYVCSK